MGLGRCAGPGGGRGGPARARHRPAALPATRWARPCGRGGAGGRAPTGGGHQRTDRTAPLLLLLQGRAAMSTGGDGGPRSAGCSPVPSPGSPGGEEVSGVRGEGRGGGKRGPGCGGGLVVCGVRVVGAGGG